MLNRCLRPVRILLAVVGLALAGTGCGTTKNPAPPPVVPEAVVRSGYVLTIKVQVDGRKEVEESAVRVSEAGEVRLPLVAPVKVAGLTLNELRDKLAASYREYFVNPQVTADFVADDKSGVSPWGTVTVLGRVKNPGHVPLPPTRDLSLLSAIQAAGGFDTSADQGSIRVSRTGPSGAETHTVDLKSLGTQERSSVDLVLRDGDVVYVPELMF